MTNGFIDISGKEIFYEIINEGLLNEGKPLLIFLHHGLGSTEQWGDFPRILCDSVQYPALLYDRYGYGKSTELKEKRDTNYLHKEATEFLPEIIKYLKIDNKIILTGHSDGGSIGLIYAALIKEKLIGIITEAPHVFVEDVTIEGVKETVYDFETGSLRRALNRYHRDKTEKMFYGWADIWLSGEFRKWNIEGMLHEIEAPLLLIQGEEDEYGTMKQVEAIKKGVVGNCSTLLLANCNHFPHIKHKEKVTEAVKEFILKISK